MSQKKSRLRRKADRVVKTQVDREYNAELGALRRARQDAFVAADAEFAKEMKKLEAKRMSARHDAREAYDKAYAKLVKELADREERAA